MSESVVYQCLRCGEIMTEADLHFRGGIIKCVNCSFKVLKKMRAPVVKRVKAK